MRYLPIAALALLLVLLGLRAPSNVAAAPDLGDASRAAQMVNTYRAIAGLPPLAVDARLSLAALAHARYVATHLNNSAAFPGTLHGEVPGFVGFTGARPADRGKTAGYDVGFSMAALSLEEAGPTPGTVARSAQAGSFRAYGENLSYSLNDPAASLARSVDGLIAAVYHRNGFLGQGYRDVGYGGAVGANSLAVFTYNFGTLGSDIGGRPVPYPADGQTGVPTTWVADEVPDPLPPGAPRTVGYVVSLHLPFEFTGVNVPLALGMIRITDPNGAPVDLYLPDPSIPHNTFPFAIPRQPLRDNTCYTVRMAGTSTGGTPFDRTWRFGTGRAEGCRPLNGAPAPATPTPQSITCASLPVSAGSPIPASGARRLFLPVATRNTGCM